MISYIQYISSCLNAVVFLSADTLNYVQLNAQISLKTPRTPVSRMRAPNLDTFSFFYGKHVKTSFHLLSLNKKTIFRLTLPAAP